MATWDGNMDRHTISADLGFSARDLSDPSTDIALTSLSEDYKSQETQFKNTITTLGGYHTCLIKRTLLAADKPNHVKSPLYWDMWPIQSMYAVDESITINPGFPWLTAKPFPGGITIVRCRRMRLLRAVISSP